MRLRSSWRAAVVALALVLALAVGPGALGDKPKDCEVCIRVLESVERLVKLKRQKDKKKDPMAIIEATIDEVCADATSQTDKKMCYYLTPIKRKVSTPMSSHMPADRICKKLKSESQEICQVREAVKVEKGKTDYSKMRIKDLKKILMDRGVQCTGCLEKSEFVDKCKDTEDLHVEL